MPSSPNPIRISVQNIGPIRSGSLSLAPLTVVIGPNNAGKSVLAMIAYASTHARHVGQYTLFRGPGGRSIRLSTDPRPRRPELGPNELHDTVECVKALFSGGKRITPARLPNRFREFLDEQIEFALNQYATNLLTEIERCFGAKLVDLVRHGTKGHPSTVTVQNAAQGWKVLVELSGGRSRLRRTVVLQVPQVVRLLESLRVQGAEHLLRDRAPHLGEDWIYRQLVSHVVSECFSDFPYTSYYLPAARSGILQSHKALASFVMSRAPLAGLEDMQIPRMTGVITDFISHLLEMESRRTGPFHGVAKDLESELLHGGINIRVTPNSYPEISYRSSSGQLPLHRTSSMVSEIAPVVLLLRNAIDPSELLIIEEPESHLHPESQVIFARALVHLVRLGLRVMLTTHSDYFLTAINNAIASSALTPGERASLDVSEDETLSPDSVDAYLLTRTNDGTAVRALQVSSTGGILEEEFAAVAEAMYDRTVRLDARTGRDGET